MFVVQFIALYFLIWLAKCQVGEVTWHQTLALAYFVLPISEEEKKFYSIDT
jgi:hypothetical protein